MCGCFFLGVDVMGELCFDGWVVVVIGGGCGLGCVYVLLMVECGVKIVVNDFGVLMFGDDIGEGLVDVLVNEICVVGGEVVVSFDLVVIFEGVKVIF